MSAYLYLHGLASSPQSTKAQYLRARFAAWGYDLQVLDLNQDDFTHLTRSRQLAQASAALPPADLPTTVIGSSCGGLTAAWLAEQHSQIARVILLAPAFDFLTHWRARLGAAQWQQWQATRRLPVYHYGAERLLPLDYGFVEDLRQYEQARLQRPVPTLLLHGDRDEIIPLAAARAYASARPWVKLQPLASQHSLSNVLAAIWTAIARFCHLQPPDRSDA